MLDVDPAEKQVAEVDLYAAPGFTSSAATPTTSWSN
jgi:hypothetical protein